MMNIEYANAEYTGGGVYVFYGKVDGKYFLTNEDFGMILNTYPDISNDQTFDVEWQNRHIVKEIIEGEIDEFNLKVIDWIVANSPTGNYDMYELKHIRNSLEKPDYVVGYIPSLDRTVIFKETEKESVVCGWYFGRPDDKLTKEYAEAGVTAKF